MGRKVFLSFLGVSTYEPVRYFLEKTGRQPSSQVERYVQTALLDHLADAENFSAGDLAVVFLTEAAKNANWSPKNGASALEAQIVGRYPFEVIGKPVGDESSTDTILDNFLTIYDVLQKEDIIYLDITHSWRYLPLLGATLLNYAKALKAVQVKAIYYGALERLGTREEVKALPEPERWVPILDLVEFSELQEWAAAARDFVDYGKPARWRELAHKSIEPVMRVTEGRNADMALLRGISNNIYELVSQIETNRGKDLMGFKFNRLDEQLRNSSMAANNIRLRPLRPILDLVRDKVAPFGAGGDLSWLSAVQWCIDHGLIQQGVTQLQEGLITWLCLYFREGGFFPEFFDWTKADPRELLGSALSITRNTLPAESSWTGALGKHKAIGRQVMDQPVIRTLAARYQALSDSRNDINHGGYTKGASANSFEKKLRKYHAKIRALIAAPPQPTPQIPSEPVIGNDLLPELPPGCFLNLSNHPSDRWGQEQQEAARAEYGPVADAAFPDIAPEWDTEEVHRLADRYLAAIEGGRPKGVHLMGEMTFTLRLAGKLLAAGIPCVAATSRREVQDLGDGRKEVKFRFVRFRPYGTPHDL